MKKYLLIAICSISIILWWVVYALLEYFSWSIGITLNDGEFRSDGTGNAWQVSLDGSYLDDDILGWSFWIQTAGTGTFDSWAMITYTWTGNPTLDCWSVLGTASSPNIGTIELDGPDALLLFNPVSRKLEWYGWNNGIGRVPFWAWTCNMDVATNAGFIGRVKVIGNMWGISIFSTFYDDYATRFNANLFNTALQRIRKNIWLLTRNISWSQKNETFSTDNTVVDTLFYINSGTTLKTKTYSSIKSIYTLATTRSLVIVGGDLYIDEDILNSTWYSKWIIVLKNENNIGGNIYVHRDVKHIQATIFAEWTIYSGENSSTIYNDSASELTSLPDKQLYIEWSFLSRNTIWWASKSKSESICPYNSNCNFVEAIEYDLNYFRAFDTGSTSNRAYTKSGAPDDSLDEYSLVIEYDSRVLSDPPPGFE